MMRTMGGPFGTVALTVMGEGVLSRRAISTRLAPLTSASARY